MDSPAAFMGVVESASAALRSDKTVPSAMLSIGVFQAVVALAFLVAKPPQGIFSHHGAALLFVYYTILIAGAVVGAATTACCFWVARDPRGRRAIGTAVLCVATATLIPVSGILVGFLMLKN
ncbi:hypothetical protein BS78_09G224000 [Paspalum vaginatum]|nr:hypothetical protein BS78_09G224000 [Paspalum vaginatum]